MRAEAKKVGVWNKTDGHFEPVPWLPQPNQPILLVTPENLVVARDAIGHFPGTQYQVRVKPSEIVTHNTAILGILGVGKSFLAIEIVERMIADNIKIICLDLTNQYAQQLTNFYDSNQENQKIEELNKIGCAGKSQCKKNVEEGGSIKEFTAVIKEELKKFLSPDSIEKIKIYNPVKFEV